MKKVLIVGELPVRKYNFNKEGFEAGDIVFLDKGHPNGGEVVVIGVSDNSGMFVTVQAIKAVVEKRNIPVIIVEGEPWDTMTNRLSKLKIPIKGCILNAQVVESEPVHKGIKHYYFDSEGNFYFDPTLVLNKRIIYDCLAVNDRNAIRKYKKRFK